MPVLRRDHQIEAQGERVGDGHDHIAIGDGQRTERHEVVLDVDEQQCAHVLTPPVLGEPTRLQNQRACATSFTVFSRPTG